METTKQTQPWFVWETEEPGEGSICVDAESAEAAKAQYVACTGCEFDEGDTAETALTAKPATAEAIGKLQDEIESLHAERYRMRKALREIEAHHVEQNRISRRDESRSKTLRLAREGLDTTP